MNELYVNGTSIAPQRRARMRASAYASLAALIAGLSGFAMQSTFADDMADSNKHDAKAAYKQSEERAEADYAEKKAQCKQLTGDERKACYADAKADEKKAKADAKAQRAADLAQVKADAVSRKADYKAAKEKCEALSGDAEDACIADAKVKYHR